MHRLRRMSIKGKLVAISMLQSDDGLGALIDGFNDMLVQLQVRDEQLAGHRQLLEAQVAERTATLMQSNQALEQNVVELGLLHWVP
jgi:nitrate/nitrite-specific signal transduction histidine kinase